MLLNLLELNITINYIETITEMCVYSIACAFYRSWNQRQEKCIFSILCNKQHLDHTLTHSGYRNVQYVFRDYSGSVLNCNLFYFVHELMNRRCPVYWYIIFGYELSDITMYCIWFRPDGVLSYQYMCIYIYIYEFWLVSVSPGVLGFSCSQWKSG